MGVRWALLAALLASVTCTPPPAAPPPPSPPAAAGGDGDDSSWTEILGIIMGLLASIGINLGQNLQSNGMHAMAMDPEATKKPRIWWIGAITFGVASIVNFGAFGLAPASRLAPLEAIQFVTNLLFNKFINHKHITRKMIWGSVLIVVGCVLAVVTGPNEVAEFTVQDLTEFWYAPGWIIYCCFCVCFAGTCHIIHMRFEAARSAGNPMSNDEVILPITYAISSAVVGSMCVVMAKCMSELTEIFITDGPVGEQKVPPPLRPPLSSVLAGGWWAGRSALALVVGALCLPPPPPRTRRCLPIRSSTSPSC